MSDNLREPRTLFGLPIDGLLRLGREGVFGFACQIAGAVIGLLSLRVITGLVDRDVFGEASLMLGAVALAVSVFFEPVKGVLTRYHPEYATRGQLHAFKRFIWRSTARHLSWMATLGLGVYLIWRFSGDGGLRPLLLLATLVLAAAQAIRSIPLEALSASRAQYRLAIWSVTENALSLGVGILGLLLASVLGRLHVELYLFGQAVGVLLCMLGNAVIWGPPREQEQDQPLPSEEEPARLLRQYGFPQGAIAAVVWVLSVGDRYVVGAMLELEAVGVYVAFYSIASRAVMMPNGVVGVLLRPILFQAEARGQRARARQVFIGWLVAVALSSALVCSALWLAWDWVADLLLDPRYRSADNSLILWIVLGHAINCAVQAVENRLFSLGTSIAVLWPTAVGAVVNLIATWWLIPSHGTTGAAMGTALAYACHGSLAVVALLRHRREQPQG